MRQIKTVPASAGGGGKTVRQVRAIYAHEKHIHECALRFQAQIDRCSVREYAKIKPLNPSPRIVV